MTLSIQSKKFLTKEDNIEIIVNENLFFLVMCLYFPLLQRRDNLAIQLQMKIKDSCDNNDDVFLTLITVETCSAVSVNCPQAEERVITLQISELSEE